VVDELLREGMVARQPIVDAELEVVG